MAMRVAQIRERLEGRMTANQAEVEFWEEVVRSDPGRQALLDSARHIRDYMAGVYQKLLAELERKP